MKRVDYAIQSHRLNPAALDYTTATEHTPEQMRQFKNAMEEIDDLSARFAFCKTYQSPERTRQFFSGNFSGLRLAVGGDECIGGDYEHRCNIGLSYGIRAE